MVATRITVAVVEDDPLHRERFRDNLAGDASLLLCGEFATARDACAGMAALAPDVLLVDLGLPDASGFDVIAHARAASPGTEIMVVSIFGGEANLLRAIESGATGYLLKDCLPADFVAAIHALRAGEAGKGRHSWTAGFSLTAIVSLPKFPTCVNYTCKRTDRETGKLS